MSERKNDIKCTVVSYHEASDEEFRAPSKYFIINCMGDYVYFHCRDRQAIQNYVNSEYGANKYKVCSGKMEKGGEVSVRASMNNKSRSGTYTRNIKNSQGY